jgi:hypothetical protein
MAKKIKLDLLTLLFDKAPLNIPVWVKPKEGNSYHDIVLDWSRWQVHFMIRGKIQKRELAKITEVNFENPSKFYACYLHMFQSNKGLLEKFEAWYNLKFYHYIHRAQARYNDPIELPSATKKETTTRSRKRIIEFPLGETKVASVS